jgi:hypothetical protein
MRYYKKFQTSLLSLELLSTYGLLLNKLLIYIQSITIFRL